MTRKIQNIVYMEIGKGKNDQPVFINYAVQKIKKGASAIDILESAVIDDKIPKCADQTDNRSGEGLSFKLVSGYNIYAIKFCNDGSKHDGHARFGPGMVPITLVGCNIFPYKNLISEVRLMAKKCGCDEIITQPAECIPADFDKTLEKSWIIFECDYKAADYLFNHGHPVVIPFYLNIYDEEYKVPIWLVGEDKWRSHDGYHPSDSASYAKL